MKKALFSLIVMLSACIMPLSAQENQEKSINGSWQRCLLQKGDSGQLEIRFLPILKVISEGQFTDIVTRPSGNGFGIAAQGTFTQADSTITLKQGDQTLTQTFHLQGPQWMVIDQKKDDTVEHAIWMRLGTMPNSEKIIERLVKGDDPSQKGPQMRGRMGDASGQRPAMGRRGGNRQRGQFQNNNQQQTNSNVDNSWMNED